MSTFQLAVVGGCVALLAVRSPLGSTLWGVVKSLLGMFGGGSSVVDANAIRDAYLLIQPALDKPTQDAVEKQVAHYLLTGEKDGEANVEK